MASGSTGWEVVTKSTLLILDFFMVPFFVLLFSCYILMTLLMLLLVISLSMLMILLYTKYNQASDL